MHLYAILVPVAALLFTKCLCRVGRMTARNIYISYADVDPRRYKDMITIHLSTAAWNVIRFVLTEVTVSFVISECYNRLLSSLGRYFMSLGKPLHVTSSRFSRMFPLQAGIWPARSHNESAPLRLSRIIPTVLSCIVYSFILASEFSSKSVITRSIPAQQVPAYALVAKNPNYTSPLLDGMYNIALEIINKCGVAKDGEIALSPLTVSTKICLPPFQVYNHVFTVKDVCVAAPTPRYAQGEDCSREFDEVGMSNPYRTYTFEVKSFVDQHGDEIVAPSNPHYAKGFGVVGLSPQWNVVYCRILKTRIANSLLGNTGAIEACLFSTKTATLVALPGVEFINAGMTRGTLPDAPISDVPTLLKVGSTVWFAGLVPSATVLFPFPIGTPQEASSMLRVVLQKLPRGESSRGGTIDQRAAVPQLMRPLLLTRLGIGAISSDHNNTAKLVERSRASVDVRLLVPLYSFALIVTLMSAVAGFYETYTGQRFNSSNLSIPLDFESALMKMVSYDLNDGTCATGSPQLVRMAVERSANPDYQYHLAARSKAQRSITDPGTIGAKEEDEDGCRQEQTRLVG